MPCTFAGDRTIADQSSTSEGPSPKRGEMINTPTAVAASDAVAQTTTERRLRLGRGSGLATPSTAEKP